jgi:hypothetical protein
VADVLETGLAVEGVFTFVGRDLRPTVVVRTFRVEVEGGGISSKLF